MAFLGFECGGSGRICWHFAGFFEVLVKGLELQFGDWGLGLGSGRAVSRARPSQVYKARTHDGVWLAVKVSWLRAVLWH